MAALLEMKQHNMNVMKILNQLRISRAMNSYQVREKTKILLQCNIFRTKSSFYGRKLKIKMKLSKLLWKILVV